MRIKGESAYLILNYRYIYLLGFFDAKVEIIWSASVPFALRLVG